MRLLVIVGLMFHLAAQPLRAQVDSVLLDSTLVDPRGIVVSNFTDSIVSVQATDLGEVLGERSLVFVKPSSGNGLSTISLRGGNTEQVAVYWNGLNLQSTLNGTVDMNLMSTAVFDEIEVNSGSSSNVGSGAIAGTIELNNSSIDTNTPGVAQISLGSYALTEARATFRRASKNTSDELVLFSFTARNDYPYQDINSRLRETKELEHASFATAGFLAHHQQRIKGTNPLNARLWIQTTDRDIPATQLEGKSRKYQQDFSIRFQSDWSKTHRKTTYKVNVGSFMEKLSYQDSNAKIYADYLFHNQAVLMHVLHQTWKKIQLGTDIEARRYWADADTFYEQQRIETAVAFHGRYRTSRTTIQASMRAVRFTGNSDQPILGALTVEQRLNRRTVILTRITENYRMPTFNNLYWNPGGNSDLISEHSTNTEIGLVQNRGRVQVKLGAFNNYISNQIRWLPGSSGYFEARQQAGQVQWNRGLEFQLLWHTQHWKLFANSSYVNSTNQTDDPVFGGLQQTYIPHFQGNSGLKYTWKYWSFTYSNWYVSERFTDVKNTEELPGIFIQNISFGFTRNQIRLLTSVKNVANVFYTVQPFMPNKPRNFKFTIQYKITKNERS